MTPIIIANVTYYKYTIIIYSIIIGKYIYFILYVNPDNYVIDSLRRFDRSLELIRMNSCNDAYTCDFDSATYSSEIIVIIPQGQIPARIPI